MFQRHLFVFLAAFLAAAGQPAAGETPEEKGLRIATEGRNAESGFGSLASEGRMVLRDRSGGESIRDFRSRTLEVADDGDKTMIVFESPPDIAGTALLTHAHIDGDDDQWFYLSAIKRVKRITSSGRTGSFAGSEFTYEDLVATPLERFDYLWIRDEPCPRFPELVCHVNQRVPKDRDSGYSRQVYWLDTEEYRVHRVELYDRKGAHIKSMTVDGHRLYENRYWRPSRLTMRNLRTGKSTDMLWTRYDFSVAFDDNDFSRRALERVR